MRKIIFILFLFCIVSLTLYAQKQKKNQKDSIVFTELVHNYGTIKVGGNGKCEFKFINKMKKPLVLFNVKASCGCTVAEYPKNPIGPGKEGVIIVKYNTRNAGGFNKSLWVYSNARNSIVTLKIKGNVK